MTRRYGSDRAGSSAPAVILGVRPRADIAPTAGGAARLRAPRHVLPREVAIAPRLAGQAEHPLAQDVAHHLRRAALDRVGAGPQERPAGVAAHEPGRDRAAQLVALGVEHAVAAEQVDAEVVDVLVE